MTSFAADDIVRAATSHLERVKRHTRVEWVCHVLAFVCAVAAVVIAEGMPQRSYIRAALLVVTGLLGGAAEAVGWLWRHLAHHRFLTARRLRRIALAADGLGEPWHPGSHEEEESITHAGNVKVPMDGEPYYGSKRGAGWDRLIDDIRESAFFSGRLYNISGAIAFTVIALFFAAAIVVSISVFRHERALGALTLVSQFILIAASFMAGSGLIDEYVRWRRAEEECLRVLADEQRLESERDRLSDQELQGRALMLFADYAAATLIALPPPTWLYLFKRKQLNAEYERRYGRPKETP